MKRFLFLAVLFGISNAFFAQSLKFVETSYEFYHIQEVAGSVQCQFLFTNIASKDVSIKSVNSNACPCLSFAWKQGAITPGNKGTITVTVDPRGRKGMFAYPLTVVVLEDKKEVSYELMVKGYIVPKPQTKEEEYSMMEGHLRYITNQKKYVMHREQIITDTFRFYNVWDSVMTFEPTKLPSSIKVLYCTPSLNPKEEGYVVFSFDAAAKNDWGPVWDRLFVLTNDPDRPEKTFYIIADIYDNFSAWTPDQVKNAPHIYSEKTEYDFGTDTAGKIISYTFTIKNTGKSKLLIHKVKTSCGCTTLQQIKPEIEPGESVPVEAVFRSQGKSGSQLRNIDIITNDPDQPKMSLFIKGNLLEVPNH